MSEIVTADKFTSVYKESMAIDKFWRNKIDPSIWIEVVRNLLITPENKRRIVYRNAIEVGAMGDQAPTYTMWFSELVEGFESKGNRSDKF